MSCFVYLIQRGIDGSFYVGISQDPQKRLAEHNSGKLKITSKKKPYILVYLKEYEDYQSARKHELWLKKKNTQYKSKLAQLAPPSSGGVK
ncbi:MAG: GIY-YIG nuclease family protein [bacterium]|nr:GIY-YIG nuclease family protein [bacterium]